MLTFRASAVGDCQFSILMTFGRSRQIVRVGIFGRLTLINIIRTHLADPVPAPEQARGNDSDKPAFLHKATDVRKEKSVSFPKMLTIWTSDAESANIPKFWQSTLYFFDSKSGLFVD